MGAYPGHYSIYLESAKALLTTKLMSCTLTAHCDEVEYHMFIYLSEINIIEVIIRYCHNVVVVELVLPKEPKV